jgi:hypothetical protein
MSRQARVIQCHLKSIDIKLANNKTSPRLHHQIRILVASFYELSKIVWALEETADDAAAKCSFVGIINQGFVIDGAQAAMCIDHGISP